jgi:hypothetical protein
MTPPEPNLTTRASLPTDKPEQSLIAFWSNSYYARKSVKFKEIERPYNCVGGRTAGTLGGYPGFTICRDKQNGYLMMVGSSTESFS